MINISTTSQLLHDIADAGKFELLATDFLRYNYPEIKALIHTGVTTTGKTRVAPLDGFIKVPRSDPPLYVMVQHTTINLNSLKGKWIEDLEKAYNVSLTIQDQSANFIVYLTSNKIINLDICIDIYQRAKELNIEAVLIENRIITSFLDNDENGQWLRKSYFGIDDEKLSNNRFIEICSESVEKYKHDFIDCDIELFIKREIEEELKRNLKTSRKNIIFLLGESGYGKSSIAFNILSAFKTTELVMWLPPEIIEGNYSLQDSLSTWFKTIYPKIELNSGEKALKHITISEKHLFIVVDDINRTDFPTTILEKLIRWSRAKDSLNLNLTFIIPLWPSNFRQIKAKIKGIFLFDTYFIEEYSLSEAKKALVTGLNGIEHTFSSIEIETIVKKLGFDPFLIGLFIESVDFTQDPQDLEPIDIISRYVEICTQELGDPFTNYNDIILELTSHLMSDNNHYVTWAKVTEWFSEQKKIGAFKNLVKKGKILRVDESSTFSFRHDRLKDHFMIKIIVEFLKSDDISNQIFSDPFYAPLIACAIDISFPSIRLIKELMITLPTIPFEYLKVSRKQNSVVSSRIIEVIIEWIKYTNLKENIDDPVIWELFHTIGWLLAETDSSNVLEITKDLPHYDNIALARLRNGLIDSGIRYCKQYGIMLLRMNDSSLYKILEHTILNHKDMIIDDLIRILKNPSEKNVDYIKGALFIIGHLQIHELEDELVEFWNLTKNKTEIFSLMLWAVFRCCDSSLKNIMKKLMDYWLTLPEEGDYSIGEIATNLELAIKEEKNPKVIEILIEGAENNELLNWPIKCLLRGVDSPNALEFVVKAAAEIKKSLKGTNKFSPWLFRLDDEWNPKHPRSRKMSKESVNHLKSIWKNDSNDEYVRNIALDLWLYSLGQDDLDYLREMQREELFYDAVLYRRVELGDPLSIFDYCTKLESRPIWVGITNKLWNNTFVNKIIELIGREEFTSDMENYGKESFFWDLAELLTKISENEANKFIVENWDIIKSNSKIIQATLFVGTERCLKLVEQEIANTEDRENIFKHISFLFGCGVSGKSDYLTLDKITNIVPYLDYIQPNEIGFFGKHCQKIGAVEWSKKNLYTRMDPLYKKVLHPTDDQLFSKIEEILQMNGDNIGSIYYWVKGFDERKDPKARMMELLNKMFEDNQSYKVLEFISNCLKIKGDRRDLKIFERDFPKENSNRIEKLIEATKFSVFSRTLH